MSGSSSEEDLVIYASDEKWNSSVESIISHKLTKLIRSESFSNYRQYNPNLTSSELELRETHLKNFKDKNTREYEKTRFPRIIQTRSLLRDELEILKINMSLQEGIVSLSQAHLARGSEVKEGNKKRSKKHVKTLRNPSILRIFTKSKIKDLLTEIEGSESAKTDKKIWKFLKRGSSFRREAIKARKLTLQFQAPYDLDFTLLSESCFQNSKPTKVTCPNCRFFITTNIKKVSTIRTKITSLLFSIVGLCIVPHVLYPFKDTVHLCPLCKIYLGFCPAFNIQIRRKVSKSIKPFTLKRLKNRKNFLEERYKMVSASSTSAKNLFVESKLRLSDRVQVNVNNIAAITRQIQRGSKASENLMTAAKNLAIQDAAIENSDTNLKKLRLLTTHINNQLDSLHNSSAKMETVLEQVRSMQR